MSCEHKELLQQRLSGLREKLLDLSNRNRLLSFKHSERSRTHVRVIDELPDVLFSNLSAGKRMRFKPLPEPETEPRDEDTDEFVLELEAAKATDSVYVQEVRALAEDDANSKRAQEIERALRDRVRAKLGMEPWVDQGSLPKNEFARLHGLEPGYDLPEPVADGGDPDRHLDDEIQTLLYPREMDRKLKGIVDQARTMLNEAGVNTLRTAFGFLEWQEAEYSQRRHLSPLILLPVTIEHKRARPWRRYDIFGEPGEVETNKTLAIRLSREIGFSLPAFEDEDSPESYLTKIAQALEPIPNWRVRRFVTVGNFGFSKLAMYGDLDHEAWDGAGGLFDKNLLQKVLLGEEREDGDPFDPPDYEIDNPGIDSKNIHLVTDADASQHSAIVDVYDGKNSVIIGPPGTGKSQTITNIISASIAAGKKVLFVAEKMAALDVVYSRLRHAGLGEFCLEVHSNKTRKTEVLQSLRSRLELQNQIAEPEAFSAKLEGLHDLRDRLNRYVNGLNTKIGSLGMTAQQILWGQQRAVRDAGDAWEIVQGIEMPTADDLSDARRNAARHAIHNVLTRIPGLAAVKGSFQDHPWAWVGNYRLSPIEQEELIRFANEWRSSLEQLASTRADFITRFGSVAHETPKALHELSDSLSNLPKLSDPSSVHLVALFMADGRRALVSEFLEFAGISEEEGDGNSELFQRGFLPSVNTSWVCWKDKVVADLDCIGAVAPRTGSLAAARNEIHTLEEIAARLGHVLDLTRLIGDLAGLSSTISTETASSALQAAELLMGISRDELVRRNRELFKEESKEVLMASKIRAEDINNLKAVLSDAFVFEPLPDPDEVDIHARALRSAGALGSLKGSARRAKKFFRSIAKPGFKTNSADRVSLLTRLSSYLHARRELEQNLRLAEICGQSFNGVETDFDILSRIHDWSRKVCERFSVVGEENSAFRTLLLEGPTDQLRHILGHVQQLDLEEIHAWLDQHYRENTNLEATSEHLISRIGTAKAASESLSDDNIADAIALDKVRLAAEKLASLDDIREALPDEQIGISSLAGAISLSRHLAAAELPSETVGRILSDDIPRNLDWLGDYGALLCEALDHEKDNRVRFAEAAQLDERSFADVDTLEDTAVDVSISRLDDASSCATELGSWRDFLQAKNDVVTSELGDLIQRLTSREVSASQGVAAYDALVYHALARSAYGRITELQEFDGLAVELARERFQELDREILKLQREKIRAELCRSHVPRGVGVGLKREYTNLALIRAELAKKRRHIPLRDLFHRAGSAVQQLKPCMMMSPLSVATYLEPGKISFDVLVIDEASQMPPEDAIGALVRTRQCVIVGDQQQLPPTSFFRRFDDALESEDDEDDEDLDVESILDQAYNVFQPPRQLRWHYRSRHHSLIAFSNKHFYENKLTVFPSPEEQNENLGVRLVQVDGQYADRHNPAEVREICKWASEFMRHRPGQSLGIVAVNQLQRDLINDEMDRIFESEAAASKYRVRWDGTLNHFFVKNLENVQGDERDVIAISTVYGPNADGRVAQNFGPISMRNGHRRLNVLFTRAREQVVLFSSLKPDRINIGPTTQRGPRVLRNYLEYASSGRLDPGKETRRDPDSDFEVFVADRLEGLGYEAVPQVGVGGYRIDIGVRHPDFPDVFLVGIECDGATYHSGKSARDRDRLREEVLRGLGWKIYRIWSTDWFRDPDGETEKIKLFIEDEAGKRRDRLSEPVAAITPELEPILEGLAIEASDEEPEKHELSDFEEIEAAPSDDALPEHVVEIGDTVTYHFEDKPDDHRTLTIVIDDADPRAGTVSAHSPVGEALVGAGVGEDVEVFGSQGSRTAIIDEIHKEAETREEGPDVSETEPDLASFDGEDRWENEARSSSTISNLGSSSGPQPYQRWIPRPVPDPRASHREDVARFLREIIEVEGPIRVHRAYRLYAQACGINRVGRAVRSSLNSTLHDLVRRNEVELAREGSDGSQISSVARIRGTPRIIVRTQGERDFWDIPPSEFGVVIDNEIQHAPRLSTDDLFHRVLRRYGIRRLTTKISTELERIRHEFSDGPGPDLDPHT